MTTKDKKLVVAEPTEIKKDLGLIDPQSIGLEGDLDPNVEKKADDFLKVVLAFNPADPTHLDDRDKNIAIIEGLGARTQRDAAYRSNMLKEPIRKLATRGEDGGPVATSLVDLKNQVEALDPGKFDFKAGWLTRSLGKLPGLGSPLKKYFTQFESAQTVIDAIVRSLEDGKNVLGRDNVTLAQDQKMMRLLTFKLERAVQLGMFIDSKLGYALEREIASDDPRRRFIQDELLFPLRQRIQDLQQQLAVNQQGVMAIEIIVRNNKELVKGVDRAINVTVNALNTAVTVALALNNQKIVLSKIDAVNKTTSSLIAQTAATLRTQGVEVQKQASSTQLDMNSLKQAFTDINAAIDDISSFRQKALPEMANTILELDRLTTKGEESIRRMEQGNKAAPTISLDIEDAEV